MRSAATPTAPQQASTNRYSIDIVPTVALSNDIQLFGKVSSIYGNAASSDGVNNHDVQGVGYGVGVRKMLDKICTCRPVTT